MLKKQTADDDSESQKRTDVQSPEVCVDYLSYTFDEMDLAASWRVMTKQKKDIANGIRLENASWRTWAKQRNHLKTITPETLNWLKDSDVTWLYGPLHTVTKSEQKDRYAPKESSAHDKFGLIHASDPVALNDIGITGTPSTPMTVTRAPSNVILPAQSDTPCQQQRPLKSALKKVTMSDILRRSASEFHVSDLDNSSNHKTNSNSPGGSTFSLAEANRQFGAFSPSVVATHRQPKLRFNQRVEQYMVISDDDGSSTNGSVPKVKMSPHLTTRYDDDNDGDASSDSLAASDDDDDNDNYHRNDLEDSEDIDSMDEDTLHRPLMTQNGNEYHHRHYTRDYLVDSDDDDDSDDGEVIMIHPHQSNRHDGQQNVKTFTTTTTTSSYVAPRSIKRIESAILKSSSYSDTSRRGSLSSWDDDDGNDRRSIHLPDCYEPLGGNNINHSQPDQSIQWKGQSCLVYDVAVSPSEVGSDFMDDDDWEIRRQSMNSSSCISDKINDMEIDIEDLSEMNYNDSNSKNPMLLKNPPKPNPAALVPPASILSPGKASKSQPISEPSPIDALQHHHQQQNCNETNNTPSSSASCHDRILDQQQQSQQHPSSSTVFNNLSQWASSYLRKS